MNNLIGTNFTDNGLLDKIGDMTVNDLINNPNTDVIKKGNKISVRHQTDYGVASLELSLYSSRRKSLRASSVPGRKLKKGYAEDIREMKAEGMTQKDIAFELGISESYVSQIIRQNL